MGKRKSKTAETSENESNEPAKKAKSDVPATGNVYPPPVVKHLPKSSSTGAVAKERVRVLKAGNVEGDGPVVYWMSRDQRVQDNWALLYAHHLASQAERRILVIFNVEPKPDLGKRHVEFMIKGLEEIEQDLKALGISFFVACGAAGANVPAFLEAYKSSVLVTDYSPLTHDRSDRDAVTDAVQCPFHEVDAHNIVPVWEVSEKQEWSAATFRKKIYKHLPKFFKDIPAVLALEGTAATPPAHASSKAASFYGGATAVDWTAVRKAAGGDESIKEASWIQAGSKAGTANLNNFLSVKLKSYATNRNLPHLNHLSHMSPWLNFGHVSAQRVAWEASKYKSKCKEGFSSFFEELVVRRELSDNYCHYNPYHLTYKGLPPWAKVTHSEHAEDKREYVYSDETLELGKTHDDLWNAAQKEQVSTGKMHGYVRMYWAKKVLEWTPSAEHAHAFAIQQNDKWCLDGRNPNGYCGVSWAIGGLHDRAWGPVRPVFGKIRFMNYNGCKRKFDIPKYIASVLARSKK